MDRFIDPLRGRIVTVPTEHGCGGCVYNYCADDCSRPVGAPSCRASYRADGQEVIFVRAADAPQAPTKAVRLTDEQILAVEAERGSDDVFLSFARAIETAALRANGLEIPE